MKRGRLGVFLVAMILLNDVGVPMVFGIDRVYGGSEKLDDILGENDNIVDVTNEFTDEEQVIIVDEEPKIDYSEVGGMELVINVAPSVLENNKTSRAVEDNWLNQEVARLCGKTIATLTDADYLKVTKINLPSKGLTGGIPNDLSKLSNLTYLDVSGNNLTGSIPVGISNLTKMTNLYLENNNLSGNIPEGIYNAAGMLDMRVNNNSLSGEISRNIGSMSKLKYLYLDGNDFSGQIPDTIGNLESLVRLNLYANNLTGYIPSSMGSMLKLEYLYLHENNLTGGIPSSLARLPVIKDIFLRDNNLIGGVVNDFITTPNLNRLILTDNQLKGSLSSELITKFGESNFHYNLFSNCSGQKKLIFKDSAPIDIHVSEVLDINAIKNNVQVDCKYGYNQIEELNPEYSVSIQKQDYEYIYPDGRLQQVGRTELIVGVTGESSNYGPACTDPLVINIEGDIEYEDHWLNREVARQVNKTNLKTLVESDFEKVKSIVVFNKGLTGVIPKDIGKLINLEVLDISGNDLTGPIPEEVYTLSKIRILFLYDNDFSGGISRNIKNFSSLQKFNISDNNFSGELPSEINDLKVIDTFFVKNNNFTGIIPSSVGDWQYLNIFDITNNNFYGELPKSIENLGPYIGFRVSNNQLHGIIPPNMQGDHHKADFVGNFFENAESQKQLEFRESNSLNLKLFEVLDVESIIKNVHIKKQDGTYEELIDAYSLSPVLDFEYINGDGRLLKVGSTTIGAKISQSDATNPFSKTVQNIGINISDYSQPLISVVSSNTDVTNQNIELTATASSEAGVDRIECNGSVISTTDTATIDVAENGIYVFTVYDNYGYSAQVTYEVSNIDKIKPLLVLTPDVEDTWCDSVNILVEASDNMGVEKIILPDGTETKELISIFKVSKNGTYKFKVVDTAGNETEKSITVSNINVLSLVVTNNTVEFGEIEGNKDIEKTDAIMMKVSSSIPYDIELRATDDIRGVADVSNIIDVSKLSVRVDKGGYNGVTKDYSILKSNYPSGTDVNHMFDFKLSSTLGAQSDLYSIPLSVRVIQR